MIQGYETLAFFVIWAITVLTIALFVICTFFKQRCLLQLSMLIALLCFLIQIIVCLLFMFIAAALADVCVGNPTKTLISQLPGGELQNLMQYYSTCQGTNKIGGYVDTAVANVITLGTGLQKYSNTTGSPCYDNTYVQSMQLTTLKINDVFINIQSITGCETLQSLWFLLVNSALCTNMFNGFYTLWLTQLIASFFLFWAMVMASVTWQYFDMDAVGRRVGDAKVAVDGDGEGENQLVGHMSVVRGGARGAVLFAILVVVCLAACVLLVLFRCDL
jgi:hypothetical protein